MEEKLAALKEGLTKARDLRLRAETKKENLLKQKEDILAQILAEDVDPEQLDAEISKLEKEIAALTEEIHALIPWDLIRRGDS
jgi:peptidoglycan hydrolase CwlO-like protein